jgi:hypothetical protein
MASLALVLTAACAPDPALTGQTRLPITNGKLHTGHPAVGKLIFSRTGGTKQDGACTATLVGQRTVLTAAHCLGYPNTDFISGTLGYHSRASVIHPRFDKARPYEYDLGLVLLTSRPALTPAWVDTAKPTANTPVKMIGYGETSQGAGDTARRMASNSIASVKSLYFTIAGSSGTNGNACYGDSGGPVLLTRTGQEVVAGVLSYITGACGTNTLVTRLDLYSAWLRRESGGDIRLHGVAPDPDAGPADAATMTDAPPAEAGPAPEAGPHPDSGSPDSGAGQPPGGDGCRVAPAAATPAAPLAGWTLMLMLVLLRRVSRKR